MLGIFWGIGYLRPRNKCISCLRTRCCVGSPTLNAQLPINRYRSIGMPNFVHLTIFQSSHQISLTKTIKKGPPNYRIPSSVSITLI